MQLKDDDTAFKAFGIELGINMSKKLLEYGAPGLHFYTLNHSHITVQILSSIGITPNVQDVIQTESNESLHHATATLVA
jgi:5,10-methylenetetrahydrofolate reductase